ncbi:MAG: PorT family protein [Bacteroidales bacterium]|nr:PorT family protein [Bacteroidales bacterium]
MRKIKSILIAVALLFIGSTAQSQVLISLLLGDKLNSDGLEFGLEGGFNWSGISHLEANTQLSSFNLGFYFDIRLKNQWNLYTGLLVKAKMGDDKLTANDLVFLEITPKAEEGTYSQKINYFVAPVLIKYNFKNRIYLEAGPQFSLMHKAWVEFNSEIDDRKTKIKDFNRDKINWFDAGLTIGTGYKLMAESGMTLGVKYYYGLANVYHGVSGTNNSSFFVKLNIPIGVAKSKEKTESK